MAVGAAYDDVLAAAQAGAAWAFEVHLRFDARAVDPRHEHV